jgi:hypothetical protein
MKKATWDHPRFGRFTYDDIAWVNTVDAPAFTAFRYDTGGAKEPTGKYPLAFDANEHEDLPSAVALALAAKVLANQSQLVPKITSALWDDFNGRGPNSGMWWHNDLEHVGEAVKWMDLPSPNAADDLLAMMKLHQITVYKSVDGYPGPVAELSFSAPFEDEHGIGVLTDGESILGIGYSVDVAPFAS